MATEKRPIYCDTKEKHVTFVIDDGKGGVKNYTVPTKLRVLVPLEVYQAWLASPYNPDRGN